MNDEKKETVTDIIAAKRREADFIVQNAEAYAKSGETTAGAPYDDCDLEQDRDRADEIRREAYRLEEALKRESDSIHRAMVLIAGIEMENSEDPPRLWTALEDAYNALSDALGTDGDTTSDVEEAKDTGRHFVVKPSCDYTKLREALELARLYISLGPEAETRAYVKNDKTEMLHSIDVLDEISAALSYTSTKTLEK